MPFVRDAALRCPVRLSAMPPTFEIGDFFADFSSFPSDTDHDLVTYRMIPHFTGQNPKSHPKNTDSRRRPRTGLPVIKFPDLDDLILAG